LSERRFALIIANDQYDDEGLSELQAPQLDANALAKVLSDPETCNFYVQILINRRAHRVNQVIEAFFEDRNRDDLLLLYFSGHGVKDEDGKLYFATPDTKRNRLMSTAVSASFVNDLMRRTRSRSQVLLLDCCFSGAFAKGMIAKSGSPVGSSIGTKDYFQGRGRVVLTASDAMQYAFEEDELVEEGAVTSIFTSAIVDGIETWKADRDKNDRISVTELYDYVDSYVHERTPNQRPSMWSLETQGEIIIAEREYDPDLEDEEIPEYVREVVPKEVPEVAPKIVPEVAPAEAVAAVPEVVPEVVPEAAPEVMPEAAPETVPEAAPEAVPEKEPEEEPPKVTAKEPEIISDGTPPEKKPSVSATPTTQPQRSLPLVPIIAVVVIVAGFIGVGFMQGWFGPSTPDISIDDFSASPSTITQGESFTLSWSVSGASTVTIDQDIGAMAQSGERSESPSVTTTYTLTAWNEGGLEEASVQVIVYAPSRPVVDYFTTDGTSLSWSVSSATSVSIDNGIGSVGLSGTTSVSPDENTLYTLTANNEGSTSRHAAVWVIVDESDVLAIEYFEVDGSTLSWSVTGATSITIDNGIGSVALSGTRSVSLDGTIYTLTASDGEDTREASVQVGVQGADILEIESFEVDDSTLSWSVSGATSVIIDNGVGSVALSGTRSVSPTETTTYTLTALNADGMREASVQVVVEEPGVTYVEIGITASSTSALETFVPHVEEIIEPDIAEYLDLIGSNYVIDFVIKDNQGNAAIALENTQDFKAMGIDLVIGHGWSSQCSASLSYANENDMLLFSASSTSPLLAIADDRLFRSCPNDFTQSPIITEMWDTWGIDAVLTIHRADSWGDGIWNILEPLWDDHGIENLGRIRYVGETTEFSNYLDQANDIITDAISAYGADRVGIQFMSFNELRTIQSQAADYPNLINIIWMTTESSGRDQNMLNDAGEWATQTRHFSALMSPDWTSSSFIAFDTAYEDWTGQSASFYTTSLYDACRLLVECIVQTGSTDATDITEVLIPLSQGYYGLSGWMGLDENGDRLPNIYDIWGFYEDPDTAGNYLFMKFGSYNGQTDTLSWDDDALLNYAGITRPGA